MKPIKRKKLKELETPSKDVTAFQKGDKEVDYVKNPRSNPDKVAKIKFKKGKSKAKFISKEKAERQIKRKRRRINRRNK